jgi:tetratricopeptide (TPR) repeat protein
VKAKYPCALLLLCRLGLAAVTVEIKGKVTNDFTEQQYRSVTVVITDRLGTEIGSTHPDKRGQYQIKISGPRYVIIKAVLEGYPTLRYQLDTEQHQESTTDLEHNRVFGELRIPTYYQNITFGEAETAAGGALSLEALLASEDPKAVKAYQKARRQKEEGELKKAIGSLEELTKKYRGFYIGYIDLGMILAAQNENDRALEVFTKAHELRPEHPWAYVGLGVALNNKKEFQSAAQHLEKAVAIEPGSVNAQFQLGYALFNLGDLARALVCFEQVVELDPKFNPMAYKYLSSIHVKRYNSKGAARSLESYLANFPDAPDREKVQEILKKLGR